MLYIYPKREREKESEWKKKLKKWQNTKRNNKNNINKIVNYNNTWIFLKNNINYFKYRAIYLAAIIIH